MEGQIHVVSGNGLRVRGAMSFANVPRLLRDSRDLLAGSGGLVIDLQGVKSADSAGLALLLEWVERCQQQGRLLHFRNIPQSILDIAKVSNLQGLLERFTEHGP